MRVAALWVLLAGCGSGGTDLYLGFPPAGDDALLVFSTVEGGTRTLRAVDGADPAFVLRYTDETPGPVEVLVYPPGALPLGVVDLAPVGEIGRSLPVPTEVFELRFEETAVWAPRSSPSDDTARLRLKICEPVTRSEQRWEVRGFARFAVPIDDEFALFGTSDSTFAATFVSDGGDPTEIGGDLTGAFAPLAVWRGAGQDVWFGDYLGRVSRGRLTRAGIVEYQLVFRFGAGRDVEAMDGHVDGQGNVEIFAASSTGAVAHFDGNEWRVLGGAIDSPEEGIAVVWRAPGEALVASLETQNVAVASAAAGTVRPDTGPPGEVRSATFVPSIGEVLGVQSGELYTRDGDGAWRPLNPPLSLPMLGLEPRADGVDYLLASGRVGRYHHPFGICPDEGILPTLGFQAAVARLGEDLFVVGELNAAVGRSHGARVFFGR